MCGFPRCNVKAGRKRSRSATPQAPSGEMAVQLAQPQSVTVRSYGPANSTERLKIRLNEAVANMEANELMEVVDKQKKKKATTQDMATKTYSKVGPISGSRRTKRENSELYSSGSRVYHKTNTLYSKTDMPSGATHQSRMSGTSFTPSQALVTRQTADSRIDPKPAYNKVLISKPNTLAIDKGEYCVKRYRKETRTGGNWEVVSKARYAYWPPRRPGP